MKNDIAIIGMAVNLPGISNLSDLWNVIEKKESKVRPFPEERVNDLREYINYLKQIGIQEPETEELEFFDGCYFDNIKAFDYNFFGLSPKTASVSDPQQRLLLKTVYMALEDSGYVNERIRNTNTGIFIGFAANPGNMYSDYLYKIDYSLSQISLTGVIPSMFANRLSYFFDLHGPSYVVDCACSSSLVAVHNAKNAILAGDCDMAIVAGARIVYSPVKSQAKSIGIESTDGYTRTFDKNANGTGYGEGSGAIILKRLDQAEKDGDNIYAIIKGSAVNHDGNKDSITTPNANSQCKLIHKAWNNASIDPRNIKYIEAHGTATRIGDPIEIEGLRQAFSRYENTNCGLGTIKSNIGHLYEGSGIMAIIKAVLVAKNRQIPPIANYSEQNPILNLNNSTLFIPLENTEIREEKFNLGVSAFGLGGTNCHVLLENYIDNKKEQTINEPCYFTISAKTEKSLLMLIRKYRDFILKDETINLYDLCYTTNLSRSSYDVKLGIKIQTLNELKKCLNSIIKYNKIEESFSYVSNFNSIDNSKQQASDMILFSWIQGEPIDIKKLSYAISSRTISLPSYEFDEEECWIRFPNDYQINCLKDTYSFSKSSVTHEVEFVPCEYFDGEINTNNTLIIKEKNSIIPFPENKISDCIIYNIDTPTVFETEETQICEVNRIMDIIDEKKIENVIYTLTEETEISSSYKDFYYRIRKNLYTLFLLSKEMIISGLKLNLSIISRNSIKLNESSIVSVPENSTIAGFIKVIQREYPLLHTKLIDISGKYDENLLFAELFSTRQGVFCFHNYTLYKEQFKEISFHPTDLKNENYIKENGVYLITGGNGGIGLELCKHFARINNKITLILLSRSEIPNEKNWKEIIETSTNKKEVKRLTELMYIKSLGAKVYCYKCDVSDENQVKKVMALIDSEIGTINGVIHAAGVPGKSIIQNKSLKEFESVIKPKVLGSYLLESYIPPETVDFYLYFSSVATTFPSAGQSDYAAGNYYLDTISQNEVKKKIKKITCDWVAWKEVGMAVDYNTNMDTTFKAITNEEGLNVIDTILRTNKARVFGGRINYDSDLIQILPDFQISLSDGIKEKISTSLIKNMNQSIQKHLEHKVLIDSIDVKVFNVDADDNDLHEVVAKCWANCLGFTEYDANVDFLEYGGDSISALQVVSDISSYIGKDVNLASFMSNSTINKMANFINKEMNGSIK